MQQRRVQFARDLAHKGRQGHAQADVHSGVLPNAGAICTAPGSMGS